MSKSLGNVANLLDLMEQLRPARVPDAAAAVALPQPGQRRPGQPRRRRQRARRARRVRRRARPASPAADADADGARRVPRSGWTTTSTRPGATALLFDTVRRANAALDAGDPARRRRSSPRSREICAAFGLVLNAGGDVPADAAAKAAALDAARAAKDFATADAAARRAAGRRLDRRDHQGRHHPPPLSAADRRAHRGTGRAGGGDFR